MKKIFVLFGIMIFVLVSFQKETNAQIVDGAYKREDLSKRKPVPLPYVREADVMWSKKIWRVLSDEGNRRTFQPDRSFAARD